MLQHGTAMTLATSGPSGNKPLDEKESNLLEFGNYLKKVSEFFACDLVFKYDCYRLQYKANHKKLHEFKMCL